MRRDPWSPGILLPHSSDGEKAAVIMQKALLAVDSDNTRQAKANDTYYIFKRTEVLDSHCRMRIFEQQRRGGKLVTKGVSAAFG